MYKIIFTLLLITITTIIVISGCGGDNNTVSPIISTPTPDPSKTAYITVNVQWPSRGEEGKYIISSKNGEELTASITKDTQGIKFYVYDNRDPNISPKPVIGTADIPYPYTSTVIPVRLDDAIVNPNDPNDFTNILQMIPVTVRAETYQTVTFNPTSPNTYEGLISTTEKDYTIKLGQNQINLNLGDYVLTVSANPATIYPSNKGISSGYEDKSWSDLTKSGMNTAPLYTSTPGNPPAITSTPVNTPTSIPKPYSALITANLRLVCPPDTDQNGTPQPTTTPKPVANKTIRFTIVSGDGTLDSYTAVTDENGNCNVNLIANYSENSSDITSVRADFQADINDPNSIYSATCLVNVEYKYALMLKYPTAFCVNTPGAITARLKIITDPNDPNSGIPLSGKTINFNVSGLPDYCKLLSTSGTTNSNGECGVSLNMSRCVDTGVEATYTKASNNIVRARCGCSCIKWLDTFSYNSTNWPPETQESYNNWTKQYWKEAHNDPNDPNSSDTELDKKNHLAGGGLLLYGKMHTEKLNEDGTTTIMHNATMSCALRQVQLNRYRIKFRIKNGSEKITYYDDFNHDRGYVGLSLNKNAYPFHLIRFAYDNKIRFADNSGPAGDPDYENNKWYYVEIDYSINHYSELGNPWGYYQNDLMYWIYDDATRVIIASKSISRYPRDWEYEYSGLTNPAYLTLMSEGGSVWFDDVEICTWNR
jgi:hypothetical protein